MDFYFEMSRDCVWCWSFVFRNNPNAYEVKCCNKEVYLISFKVSVLCKNSCCSEIRLLNDIVTNKNEQKVTFEIAFLLSKVRHSTIFLQVVLEQTLSMQMWCSPLVSILLCLISGKKMTLFNSRFHNVPFHDTSLLSSHFTKEEMKSRVLSQTTIKHSLFMCLLTFGRKST